MKKLHFLLFLLFLFIVIPILIYLVFFIVLNKMKRNNLSSLKNYNVKNLSIQNNRAILRRDRTWRDFEFNKQPLCNFQIAGSYKSYLLFGDSFKNASYDAIKYNILSGARVIHLDITKSLEKECLNKPVVGKGKNTLDFKKCLEIIVENAWKNGNDNPLFLFLNIQTDNVLPPSQCQNGNCLQPDIYTNDNIAKMLKNMLKNRLLSKEFSYQFSNKIKFSDTPISHLLNKCVLIGKGNFSEKNNISLLDELINIKVGENDGNMILRTKYQVDDRFGSDREFIEYTKNNLYLVVPPASSSLIYTNTNMAPLSVGCHIQLMFYPYDEPNLRQYLAFFNKNSIKLKPRNLRKMKPAVIRTSTADPSLSLGPKTIFKARYYSERTGELTKN